MLRFLRGKLQGVNPAYIVFLECEAIGMWLVGGLPGTIGFAFRYAAYKVFFKELRGFCWVQPRVTIVHGDRLRVGSHFGCNSGSYINAIGGVTMGDYVLVGSNVTISSGMHPIEGREPPVFARQTVPKSITIEDDVWIGAGAVIMPGVTLRKGTVIGANAVVTKDTEEYSVNAGIPARKIRSRIAAR